MTDNQPNTNSTGLTCAIIGMGRMGQAIAAAAAGHPGVRIREVSRLTPADTHLLGGCDVAIEFTTAASAPGIIRQCLEAGIPLVSGTTGWQEAHLASVTNLRQQTGGRFLHATNFSVGMNIIFALNHRLASLMNQYREFSPRVREIHHIHKKDMPSGTAYTLLEGIFDSGPRYRHFHLNPGHAAVGPDEIPLEAIREGEVKGFHEVSWQSGGERLFIGHEAYDRSIFAEGALLAALWLVRQGPGTYTMRDVIRL